MARTPKPAGKPKSTKKKKKPFWQKDEETAFVVPIKKPGHQTKKNQLPG